MITISARIDEQTKDSAEEIANNIGLSLSAAINIFLKRFVIEQGFPFDVRLKSTPKNIMEMTAEEISDLVNQRITQSAAVAKLPNVSFLNPESNTLITENNESAKVVSP